MLDNRISEGATPDRRTTVVASQVRTKGRVAAGKMTKNTGRKGRQQEWCVLDHGNSKRRTLDSTETTANKENGKKGEGWQQGR